MSSDKQLTPNTPNGLFAFTLNPNNFVDAVKLETDFKSILSHYYHWRYGSKWRNLKHIQVPFQGIIMSPHFLHLILFFTIFLALKNSPVSSDFPIIF